jgi:hypothetical protein
MTEFGVSETSDLDAGDAGVCLSDPPKDVAMELTMVATSSATETAGATISEQMKRNENGKRRRRRVDPAAPSNWRSPMERTIRQQVQELSRLYRTVGHRAYLLEAWAALEEAQWLRKMLSMHESEQKWDTHYEDNQLWGAGITNMIVKAMHGVAPGRKGGEKERGMNARTDSGGLEASHRADRTRAERPEQRHLPQQQLKPKWQQKLKPKPQPEPKLNSAPTPATQ